MPFLTLPFLANTITRLANRAPGPRIAPEISFSEIPAFIEERSIPTRHGDVAATVYSPSCAPTEGLPVYLNFHGGGFVMRHPEQDDPLCRYLAATANVFVINVDYDVAPGCRFPGPVEQAYDAVLWAAQSGGADRYAHPWDGARLCVGGQSAGGALAAGAARLALENGAPRIALQVLHYPPLDLVTPAKQKHAAGKTVISAPMANLFDASYAPTPEVKRDRLASPAWGPNAEQIAGIAPALVITCEYDRLHDEGVTYANTLRDAGALLQHVDLPGQDHGYNLLGSDRELVEQSYRLIAEHVVHATAEKDAGE